MDKTCMFCKIPGMAVRDGASRLLLKVADRNLLHDE